ncbi:hypothetical protein BDW22DRAFT_809456 [Trametopsis cervina]|nr:hypothetical protein BDW22DRAFT_809456 [Trametopsis cervina]
MPRCTTAPLAPPALCIPYSISPCFPTPRARPLSACPRLNTPIYSGTIPGCTSSPELVKRKNALPRAHCTVLYGRLRTVNNLSIAPGWEIPLGPCTWLDRRPATHALSVTVLSCPVLQPASRRRQPFPLRCPHYSQDTVKLTKPAAPSLSVPPGPPGANSTELNSIEWGATGPCTTARAVQPKTTHAICEAAMWAMIGGWMASLRRAFAFVMRAARHTVHTRTHPEPPPSRLPAARRSFRPCGQGSSYRIMERGVKTEKHASMPSALPARCVCVRAACPPILIPSHPIYTA